MDILREPEYENRYDKNQLLILFKMYNFDQGITYILDKLNLQQELLLFYIERNEDQKIIELCKKYGDVDTNLWVQALNYFTKPNSNANFIPEILENIQKNEILST